MLSGERFFAVRFRECMTRIALPFLIRHLRGGFLLRVVSCCCALLLEPRDAIAHRTGPRVLAWGLAIVLPHQTGLRVPDLFSVLSDRAVAGEAIGASYV